MGGVGPHRVCTQFRLCVFFSAEGSEAFINSEQVCIYPHPCPGWNSRYVVGEAESRAFPPPPSCLAPASCWFPHC